MPRSWLCFIALLLPLGFRFLLLNTDLINQLWYTHHYETYNLLNALRVQPLFLQFMGGWIFPIFTAVVFSYWMVDEESENIPAQMLMLPLLYLPFTILGDWVISGQFHPDNLYIHPLVILPVGYTYVIVWTVFIWMLDKLRAWYFESMPTHTEQQHSPYTREQIFDLVADVERYPEFLPWCRAARVLERKEGEMLAELVVSFAHLTERYTSKVMLTLGAIDAVMVKGPFTHLVNRWQFTPEGAGTRIDFFLDFQFRSKLLEKLIGGFFTRAAEKMVEAFKKRADELYGKG